MRAAFHAIGTVLWWFAFPLVPAALALASYRATNVGHADPTRWNAWQYVFLLGPVFGFSFLAGATSNLPDPPNRNGTRWLISRRALWVALGPWVAMSSVGAWTALQLPFPDVGEWLPNWSWLRGGLFWVCLVVVFHCWLFFAWAALVRGKHLGRFWSTLARGLATSTVFIGSLVGGFWLIVRTLRSYFFDKTLAPALFIAAIGISVLSGCANTQTLGDVRRNQLFESMMLAWVIGLAYLWRRWCRKSRA